MHRKNVRALEILLGTFLSGLAQLTVIKGKWRSNRASPLSSETTIIPASRVQALVSPHWPEHDNFVYLSSWHQYLSSGWQCYSRCWKSGVQHRATRWGTRCLVDSVWVLSSLFLHAWVRTTNLGNSHILLTSKSGSSMHLGPLMSTIQMTFFQIIPPHWSLW